MSADAAWAELASWLGTPSTPAGLAGYLHPGLRVQPMYHGGAPMRGVVSTEYIASNVTLLRIPAGKYLDEDHLKQQYSTKTPPLWTQDKNKSFPKMVFAITVRRKSGFYFVT